MSALDAIHQAAVIPSMSTKILATGFTECGGRMAANASVAVARLGGRVTGDASATMILAPGFSIN